MKLFDGLNKGAGLAIGAFIGVIVLIVIAGMLLSIIDRFSNGVEPEQEIQTTPTTSEPLTPTDKPTINADKITAEQLFSNATTLFEQKQFEVKYEGTGNSGIVAFELDFSEAKNENDFFAKHILKGTNSSYALIVRFIDNRWILCKLENENYSCNPDSDYGIWPISKTLEKLKELQSSGAVLNFEDKIIKGKINERDCSQISITVDYSDIVGSQGQKPGEEYSLCLDDELGIPIYYNFKTSVEDSIWGAVDVQFEAELKSITDNFNEVDYDLPSQG
ncbi:MAG TPA: hypothetical protein VJI69_03535, partial [Bacteroidia bacterium]|nr:hypothetical protein [Bacteroidia bacterium]